MNRLTEAWFEFAGIRSDAMHVRLLAMPRRHMPAQRGERVVVPGRSGYLWMPDGGAYDEIAITAQCATEDGYSPEAIAAWLAGDGELRFSDEPEKVESVVEDNDGSEEDIIEDEPDDLVD